MLKILNVISLTIVCVVCTAETDNIHNSTANFTKPVTTSTPASTFVDYSNISSSISSRSGPANFTDPQTETTISTDIPLNQSSSLTTPSSFPGNDDWFMNNISQASITNTTFFNGTAVPPPFTSFYYRNNSIVTSQNFTHKENETEYSIHKCLTSTVDDNFNESGATASYYGHPNATSTTSRLSNTTHPSNDTTPRNKSAETEEWRSTTSGNVWEFLHDGTRQGFNSSTTITEETSTLKTSSSSTAHLSTEMPRLSTSKPTTSPWERLASSLPNGNHFNPIINVQVDSNSAESLEKFRRLEEMITNRINAVEKVAENLVSVFKTRINQLEVVIANLKCATTDTQQLKDHLEFLFNKHSKSLEAQVKKFLPKTNFIGNSNETVQAVDQIQPKTTTRTPSDNVEAKMADQTLAEWRAKRTQLIEKWENTFQKGLRTKKKSSKRSTHRG